MVGEWCMQALAYCDTMPPQPPIYPPTSTATTECQSGRLDPPAGFCRRSFMPNAVVPGTFRLRCNGQLIILYLEPSSVAIAAAVECTENISEAGAAMLFCRRYLLCSVYYGKLLCFTPPWKVSYPVLSDSPGKRHNFVKFSALDE